MVADLLLAVPYFDQGGHRCCRDCREGHGAIGCVTYCHSLRVTDFDRCWDTKHVAASVAGHPLRGKWRTMRLDVPGAMQMGLQVRWLTTWWSLAPRAPQLGHFAAVTVENPRRGYSKFSASAEKTEQAAHDGRIRPTGSENHTTT